MKDLLVWSPMELPSDVRSFVLINTNEALLTCSGFPLGLEKWEGSQGILNRLKKSGKTTQNTGKLRAFQKKLFVIFQ